MHFSWTVNNLILKQNITNCKLVINGGIRLLNSSISQSSKVKSLHSKCSFQSRKNVFDFSRKFSTTAVVRQWSAQDKEKFKNYVGVFCVIGGSAGVYIALFSLKRNYDDVYIEPEEKK